MEVETSTPEHGALLVAEIGWDYTYVTLVDIVDHTYRLVARAASPSTFAPPLDDPTQAILTAIRQIEAMTSRELLHDNKLIYPQNEAGFGVDGVVATTGAAGSLSVAVIGLAQQPSVASATHAVRSTYTQLINTIELAESGSQPGQHVIALSQQSPDVIMLAGGTDPKAAPLHARLGHIVRLLATYSDHKPLVIFAGSAADAEQIRHQIGDAARVEVTDTLLPLPQQPHLEPTRSLLREHYRDTVVHQLPGADHLRALRCNRLGSAAEDNGLMVRFLAQRYGRNVLSVLCDSATTACLLASDQHYSEAIFGRLGLRYGALEVINVRGAEAIQRWLPFELNEATLHNWLLNRVLRPHQTPSDLDDLLLDYALLREAVGVAYAALRAERPKAQYDLVIAGGAFADAPRPGLAALALLDGLQPTYADSDLAINLYVDQFSLVTASGALAHLDVDAAACLLEMDALNNMPLATVIVPRSELAIGKKIAEVELMPVQGRSISKSIYAGEIVRLPLARGKRATLRIRPVSGVAVGRNQPGTEVLSDEAAIAGSALGVIIDARPRPLSLPTDVGQRRDILIMWLDALDALPGSNAFAPVDRSATLAPNIAGSSEMPPNNGAHQTHDPVGVGAPTEDVVALRDSLVAQPERKRGLLRRK